jgi:hypothetical protein
MSKLTLPVIGLAILATVAPVYAVSVSETFDFSSAPITLNPYDDITGGPPALNQYVSLNVNLGQSFSSFGTLSLTGTALNANGQVVGVTWGILGNFSSGWPPPNANDGSVYAAGGGFIAGTDGSFQLGTNLASSNASADMTSRGFGLAASSIDSGQFVVSMFLCSPFCESGPSTWNGPVSFSSFTVTLDNVTVTPLPPSWTLMLIGLIGFGAFNYRRKCRSAALQG